LSRRRRPRTDGILQPVHRQGDDERQRDRADDAVIGLFFFDGVDAIAKRLVDVLHLLGEAREGLELAGDAGDQPGVDAHMDRAVLLERGLAVQARIPDEKDRLSALEMNRRRPRIEDGEGQLAAIARVHMEA
jgi:hypothetical protein